MSRDINVLRTLGRLPNDYCPLFVFLPGPGHTYIEEMFRSMTCKEVYREKYKMFLEYDHGYILDESITVEDLRVGHILTKKQLLANHSAKTKMGHMSIRSRGMKPLPASIKNGICLADTRYLYSDYKVVLDNTKMTNDELSDLLGATSKNPSCPTCHTAYHSDPTRDSIYAITRESATWFCSMGCKDVFSLTGGMGCGSD